ncbi:MAG: helix-turn-helix domain-containing protein [Bacteroidia bacterium]
MVERQFFKESFIDKAKRLVLENISNEHFGVSELADAMAMSRSNLLRKIKKETELSASVFIRQIRLEKAKALLATNDVTVSEVSDDVGFGSPSYFIKCYREHFGHPPGTELKMDAENLDIPETDETDVDLREEPLEINEAKVLKPWMFIAATVAIAIIVVFAIFKNGEVTEASNLEKSIAVLPFKNESADSTNTYFVNGLMEATLNNLQKIEDFRVVSRTSAEKYAKSGLTLSEIAEALNVNYIVEGSGQRVGDQVLLSIQLIEAHSDKHIWSEQYNRKIEDVFAIQNEVAIKIASSVQAVVTPSELEQIDKRPTENLMAYEFYLKALDPLNERSEQSLNTAIELLNKAIEYDPKFSLAYANVAIAYYFLDENLSEKRNTEALNNYADKALLYDSKLTESLIAKALFYVQTAEFRLAIPHLEKALEYNPNSSIVIQILANLYAQAIPNTSKYLEYALKGIQLDIEAKDSVSKSFIYLSLSNALIQSGFVEESLVFIDKAIALYDKNPYARYVKSFILYAKSGNLERTKRMLLVEWQKDSTRMDILQELGKMHTLQNDFDSAYLYYRKFQRTKEAYGLSIYPQESQRIGLVFEKMGFQEKADKLFEAYREYCAKDESIYKNASTAMLHLQDGNIDSALTYYEMFANEDNIQYWLLLFIDEDPLTKQISDNPKFVGIKEKIKKRFWDNHNKLRMELEEMELF